MSISVAVAGASGYAGGELLRLLTQHPDITIGAVTGSSNAGLSLGVLQPHLHSLAEHLVQPTTAEALAGHDVVFFALPHGASAPLIRQLPEDTIVIDAGADYRLEDVQLWERFYGSEHAGTWAYGLPELPLAQGAPSAAGPGAVRKQRERLAGQRRIAVPGCYPTSALLALGPGFAARLLEPEDVVIVSASGTSGAGKAAKPHLLGSEVMGSMAPYGVGGMHRHTPEIEQGLSWAARESVQISFTPTLAPMPRGILSTATARLKPGTPVGAVREAWERAYAEEEFAVLLPEGRWPSTGSVLGSNYAHLQLAVDEHADRVIVSATIDNLTKGTAGAAVQCMNIALGLGERSGLLAPGLAP